MGLGNLGATTLKRKHTWLLLLSVTYAKDLLFGFQNLLIFKELAKGLHGYLIFSKNAPHTNA
jgi:hypothetical protein